MAINFNIARVVKPIYSATYDGIDLLRINVNGKELLYQPLEFTYNDSGYTVGVKEGVRLKGEITIPGSYRHRRVNTIKPECFKDQTELTAVYFGSMTYIGDEAFANCSNLKYVGDVGSRSQPNVLHVFEYGASVFAGCNIPYIILPDYSEVSFMTIGTNALSGVNYIFFEGSKTAWDDWGQDTVPLDKVYFYSETKPSKVDKYWHYNEKGEPVLWFSECDINGHDSNLLETKEPTCSEAGWNRYVCIACREEYTEEIPATGDHKWSDWKVELEPSCIEGLQRRVCATCGGVEEEALPANGNHVWKSDLCTEPKICANCGYVDPYHTVQSAHYMELIQTHDPYCGVEGMEVYKCRHCSHQKLVNLPALDHDWDDWYPTIYPTGITEGTKRRECKRCTKIETAPIPKIETADEYFDYILLYDGTYAVKALPDVPLPAELVIPSEYEGVPVTQIEQDAFEGCNEYSPGRKIISVYIPSSIKHIGACAFQDCHGIEVIIPSSVEYVGRQAFFDCGATIYCECSESDATEWHSEWSDSDDPNTVEWDYHNDPENWEDDGLYAGSYLITVDEDATNVTVSSSCGSIAAGAVNGWTHAAAIKIPLNVQNIQPKAFTDCKNLTIYCEAESKPEGWLDGWCDSSVTIVWGYIDCKEHSWGDWRTVIPAECEVEGQQERTCSICGESETRTTPALGHDYTAEVIKPTCTESGYTKYACDRCGHSYKGNYTAALGHNYVDGICTRCNNGKKGVVYFGASTIPESYNSSFILGLNHKTASDSHLESIKAAPLKDEYIYYCAPTSFGDCAFSYNNFVGGFSLIIEGLALTNAGGKTEAYNIYKSNQANLGVNGAITITIKGMG